ncbi:unnamed protein product [Caenorhabditis sp. 36 PRJEB53466]|nr:unnamed protein product [Caenorhabditis sp. 36 PRJEB53466]
MGKFWLLLLLFLCISTSFCQEDQNLTSAESERKEIRIPSSSEVEIDASEPVGPAATPTADIAYLPLIARCSIDSDCSTQRTCVDGKCRSPTAHPIFPVFFRCGDRLDCPAGHRCILMMCIPFRW